MCGRYSIFTPQSDLEERFDARAERDLEPRYNAAPGQDLPVITGDDPGTITHQRWGFVPSWADDPGGGHINARAETAAEKPAFREAYERRRCLVLADGFYEWTERGDGGEGNPSGSKQPYRVSLADDEPFAMAGIWERWTPPEEQTGLDDFGGGADDAGSDSTDTFAILTTEPNDLVADLHHRMAVVLDPDDERRWLDGEEVSPDPYPAERMQADRVSTAVNDPSNDSPAVLGSATGS
jgi:putative SOS response-associated peptidase YedK